MLNWSELTDVSFYWEVKRYEGNLQKYRIKSLYDNKKEEPLPAGGSCLLGSINLSKFVKLDLNNNPFFDFDDLAETVFSAVVGLNEVLDEGLMLHPLEEQQNSVRDWRQIGLGVMGIADMLIKMQIPYGSKDSIELCDTIAKEILNYAVYSSVNLASKYGAFPKYNEKNFMSSEFFKENISDLNKDTLKKYGIRNSQLLTIAPTGTLSTMLGISGGIEPIFANYYIRKTESLHNEEKSYKVYTPIVKRYMDKHGLTNENELPEYFITSENLDYHQRINMQATWQKYIDASISSTINLPETATVEDVKNIYLEAWKKGLKGITIFRNNCRRVGVLTTTHKKEEQKEKEEPKTPIFDSIMPVSRKQLGTTHGNTYCKHCACGTLYITVNCDDQGHLVETFIESSKGGICKANTAAVNRMISLALRSGVKVDEVIDQLQGIYCPACMKTHKNVDGISCPDIMAKTLKEFYNSRKMKIIEEIPSIFEEKIKNDDKCPECGSPIRREGGCVICNECGWSKCG